MIIMQYAKNLAGGCGWNFNCGANDFATTSFLHTFLASIAFYFAGEPDAALMLVKIYETTVIVLAVLAFFRMLVVAGIGQFTAALSALCLLANDNTFTYMSSGMENALNLLGLSLTLTASFQRRYLLTGGLTGLCHLIRPESVLIRPVAAFIDLLRGRLKDRDNVRRWFSTWAMAGLSSLAVAVPVWLVFFFFKGTFVPVSGEVKLITAGNWGAFHALLPLLVACEIHWLPFVLIGFAVAIYKRSPALGPILTALVLVALYSFVGLPKSHWYYLPLYFGFFAATAVGVDLLSKVAKGYRWWLAPVGQDLDCRLARFSTHRLAQTVFPYNQQDSRPLGKTP